MRDAVFDALTASWPAAKVIQRPGFAIGVTPDAGFRVNASRATMPDWSQDDLANVRAENPVFQIRDEDKRLRAAVTQYGLRPERDTAMLVADLTQLTDQVVPAVTTFAIWPPLAIQRDLWTEMGINAARQDVMMRAPDPKTALLGRVKDRAAGVGFACVSGRIAMLHAIEIKPEFRRLGLGGWMIRAAAFWAQDHDATHLALAVMRENGPAMALYERLGFRDIGGYAYYR